MNGAERIAAERQRQIEVEGWTAQHDARHGDSSLPIAAACYAMPEEMRSRQIWNRTIIGLLWPWEWYNWKPTPDDRVRELEKAGALIAAEIDRLMGISDDD